MITLPRTGLISIIPLNIVCQNEGYMQAFRYFFLFLLTSTTITKATMTWITTTMTFKLIDRDAHGENMLRLQL